MGTAWWSWTASPEDADLTGSAGAARPRVGGVRGGEHLEPGQRLGEQTRGVRQPERFARGVRHVDQCRDARRIRGGLEVLERGMVAQIRGEVDVRAGARRCVEE